MDPKHFEIKEYMIIWRQLEIQNFNGISAKVRAIVRCTGGDCGMDILFLSEDSDYPDPFVEDKGNKGYMFLNIRDIMPFVDMLRFEKPIFGHLRPDRPEWMSITTTKEPIGEGE